MYAPEIAIAAATMQKIEYSWLRCFMFMMFHLPYNRSLISFPSAVLTVIVLLSPRLLTSVPDVLPSVSVLVMFMMFFSYTLGAILYVSLILYKLFGYSCILIGDHMSILLMKAAVVSNVTSGSL